MKNTGKFFGGRFLLGTIMLSSITGCELQDQIRLLMPQPKIEITMEVRSTKPGHYTLSGYTNLPDQTHLTVQAVRSLQVNAASGVLNNQPIRSVLSQRQVQVKHGQWQTEMNLHQALPNGRSIEAWQSNAVQATMVPSDQVQFVATTEPQNRAIELQPNATVKTQFASDGRVFLRVEHSIALAPPTVRSKTVTR
ncbi:hypothetical protein LEP3755_26180 [Leptolyngbya sp. NIES-3755]|nr:hypothetical protein LEP3755_26180 [Leptolyngbya sp. NIES-3755]